MKIIAYTYTEPLLDKIPDLDIWGWEIDKIYQDISDRKELNKLISDAQIETIDYLLVFNLYELGNSLSEVVNNIKKIEELNIEIVALNQEYKTSQFKTIVDNNTKEKLNQIWLEINKIHHQRRLQKSHAKNRLKTLPPPGKAPYGYLRGKDSYILNRATAPIIRAFFDRFLLYASVRDSVRFLLNKYNKKITVSTARYWLTNPVYCGDLRYKNKQVISDTHKAIITREEAAQIQRIFKSHSRVQPRSASANYCLAGLVKCSECQSNLKINSVSQKYKPKKYLYLMPIDCNQPKKCKSVSYNIILDEVITNICQEFKLILNNIKTPDIEVIKEAINNQINQRIEIINNLEKLIIQNILDQDTATIRKYKLETEISQLKTKLTQLPPNNLETIAKTLSLEQFWYDLSEEEKRFYLREFIRTIKINPLQNKDQKFGLSLDLFFNETS